MNYMWIRDMKAVARVSAIKCHYCGVISEGTSTVDHKVPKSKGGAGTRGNLVYACRRCNMAKGTMDILEFKRTIYWQVYCGKSRPREGMKEAEYGGYPEPPENMLILK